MPITQTLRSEGNGSGSLWPANRRILLAICVGYSMAVLDTTVVNVALPSMARDLGANVAGLQWVVDGYALLFAGLLLAAGALGDQFGNKRVFMMGTALFTTASMLCGLAPSLWGLVAFRALQGAGAALAVPSSLALLRHNYPDASQRAKAIGFWAAASGAAAAAGPVLGGILTAAWSWRGVFFVNVPFGILGIFMTARFVSPTPRFGHRDLDLFAQLVGVAGLSSLTFALIQGALWGWSSPSILAAFAVSILAVPVFIRAERRAANPMLPLGLFRNASFSAATVVGLILSFGFYGELFLLSLFFQQAQHRSPLVTGLAFLPETGLLVAINITSGRVTARTGPRIPMIVGQAVGGLGLFAMAVVGAGTAYSAIMAPLAAIGFGAAFTMPAMTATVIDTTPKHHAGIGSGVLNASRQVGGVLGIALLGAFVGSRGAGGYSIPGMHAAMALAGTSFLGGCFLTLSKLERGRIAVREELSAG